MRFVPRSAADAVRQLLKSFPAILVVGPRQCGKSTLVRTLFPGWTTIDLERPADVLAIRSDLEGFFERHPRRVVIDEAQRLPDLFTLLRHVIDRSSAKGRYVLTGSASPALLRSVSESLAGRVAMLELTPLRACELSSTSHAAGRWFWGGYPPVHARRAARARSEWLDSYVSAFLERDLPSLGVRLSAQRLRTLWTMLTHVHGNVLNASDLARSLGVSFHTVANDLDVLEAAFVIRRLQPFHANVQKRLTKSPKLYIRDTGLLHFLAGLRRPADLETWPRRGSSFEGLVVEELAARAAERLVRPGIFYWRTQAGAEVDLLIVDGRRIVPIEVKLGTAVDPRSLAGLRQCMADLSIARGIVVSTATEHRAVGRSIDIVPWADVVRGVDLFT